MTLMTIINLTPDSFYCPSRVGLHSLEHSIEQALEQGASIIDIGACSSRPGAEWVSCQEEIHRLTPALEIIASKFPKLQLSIDTFRKEVVAHCHNVLGRSFLVNDISGGADLHLLETIAKNSLGWVAMHSRGNSVTMDSLTNYPDVTREVVGSFERFDALARKFGIETLILDPGFGFAKNDEQCYELIRNLEHLRVGGRQLLCGISRKRFTCRPFGITAQEALFTTEALHLELLRRGADILRVHDTTQAAAICRMARMLYDSEVC